MHISMAESTFHSLFKSLHNINTSCQTEDDNRRFFRLSNIKEIVQKGLPRVRSEQVKLVKYKNDRLSSLIGAIFRDL